MAFRVRQIVQLKIKVCSSSKNNNNNNNEDLFLEKVINNINKDVNLELKNRTARQHQQK